jgi:hypothetical protein
LALVAIEKAASIKSQSGIANIAAEDAMKAARDGDLNRALICARIAAKYSVEFKELLEEIERAGPMRKDQS